MFFGISININTLYIMCESCGPNEHQTMPWKPALWTVHPPINTFSTPTYFYSGSWVAGAYSTVACSG